MTRKDYRIIVEVLADVSCQLMEAGNYEMLARAFAYRLGENASFDRDKFLKACGL